MTIARLRSTVDDRHNIRDPYGPGPNDMAIFANTLVKERVADLFRTQEGLKGHAEQIEQQLNRLTRVEGQPGEMTEKAVNTAKFIRTSIKKAMKAASHLVLHWRYYY